MVDGTKINRSALAASVEPLDALKDIEWICPPEQRRLEFLSGTHRAVATKDYKNDLDTEKTRCSNLLEAFDAQAAAEAQQLLAEDTARTQLSDKIVRLEVALKTSTHWVTRVYEFGTSRAPIFRATATLTTALQPT